MARAFKWYTKTYKFEIIDSKDPLVELEASKSSIKELFKDVFDKIKGFKYQVTVEVLLSTRKGNEDENNYIWNRIYPFKFHY